MKASAIRTGNYILQKINTRIVPVPCTLIQLEQLERGDKTIYPVVLNTDILKKAGFTENMKYTLLPQAHEFILPLPVQGVGQTEIRGYIKSNNECFARAMVSNIPVSNNIYHLHQLQNLYFALTGTELTITL